MTRSIVNETILLKRVQESVKRLQKELSQIDSAISLLKYTTVNKPAVAELVAVADLIQGLDDNFKEFQDVYTDLLEITTL